MFYTSNDEIFFLFLNLDRLLEVGEYANGSADFENIFARISDSKRDFNGFPDPAIEADCGFIYFLGPNFGLCV